MYIEPQFLSECTCHVILAMMFFCFLLFPAFQYFTAHLFPACGPVGVGSLPVYDKLVINPPYHTGVCALIGYSSTQPFDLIIDQSP